MSIQILKEDEKFMCNAELREKIKKSGLYQWEIADKLGCSEMTLIRWLRKELPEETKQRILSIISEG